MNRLAHFIRNHRTTTRLFTVIVPLFFVWVCTSAMFLFFPGLLEAGRQMLEESPKVFWGIVVAPGAVSALIMTYVGGHFLWTESDAFYRELEG